MTMPGKKLDQIQRWMQAVITHPAGVVPGINSERAQREIPVSADEAQEVVTRSAALSAVERLGIYANAYFARLLECLREEFPALRHALGEDTFDSLAIDYLREYPSTSYTLAELGKRFPKFLAESFPGIRADRDDDNSGGYRAWAEFLAELALLERVYGEIFDGPGVEGQRLLDVVQLQTISPADWPQTRLIPVCCLKLVSLQYPVHEYISAIRRKEDPGVPEASETWLAVTRKDFVIRRVPLSQPQFAQLGALMEGRSISEAIVQSAQWFAGNDDEFSQSLREWFADWSRAGFFLAAMAS
jgi:hypothetical protein